MNKPEYRKAYMSSLKMEISNNNKNAAANKGNASVQQYIQNTGKQVYGSQTNGTKKHKGGTKRRTIRKKTKRRF